MLSHLRFQPTILLIFVFFQLSLAQQAIDTNNQTSTAAPITTPTSAARPTNATNTLQAAASVSPTPVANSSASATTASAATASAATASASAHSMLNDQERLLLDTHLNAPFGILGAVLIISGAPMAFWGGRNRWSSYFLTGAYVAAIIVMVPILRFGVIDQDPNPTNVIQGLFILACLVAAVAAGGVSVIFWKGTRYLVGAGGGFVVSLFILSLRDNVLIRPPGLRWIVIIISTTIGFILATIPKLSLYITVIATAAMGSAAVMIGVDCFTTGGLKEYWVYILGFGQMFPRLNGYFPLTITMQAELGVMAGLSLAGAAVQWRLLEVIHKKVQILRQMDRERAMVEEAAAYRQSMALDADLTSWEKRYGERAEKDDVTAFAPSPRPFHERKSSQFTLLPGGSGRPRSQLHERKSSQFSLIGGGRMTPNGLADHSLPNSPLPVHSPRSRPLLPGLETGKGIADELGIDEAELRSPQPNDHLLTGPLSPRSPSHIQQQSQLISQQKDELAEIEEKMKTLDEVRQMRVSVDKLRAELSLSAGSSNQNESGQKPMLEIPDYLATQNTAQTILRPPLRNLQSAPLETRPESIATPIDFDRYATERRVGRPPGAPMSWTKRMTMVDLREPSDRFGRPLPLEEQERVKNSVLAQGPGRVITPAEPVVMQQKKAPVERRSMTIEELEARHKEAIKRLQGPTTEKMTKVVTDQGKAQRSQRLRRPSNQVLVGEASRSTSLEERRNDRTSYFPNQDRRDSMNGSDRMLPPPQVAFSRLPTSSLPGTPGFKKDKASWLDY